MLVHKSKNRATPTPAGFVSRRSFEGGLDYDAKSGVFYFIKNNTPSERVKNSFFAKILNRAAYAALRFKLLA